MTSFRPNPRQRPPYSLLHPLFQNGGINRSQPIQQKNPHHIYLLSMLILWMIVTSCQQSSSTAPRWINPKGTILLNKDTLRFDVPAVIWKAKINTPVQTIHPQIMQHGSKLWIIPTASQGVIEGLSYLTLTSEENSYIISFQLKNPSRSGQLVDTRSPKTVNTDSSLVQQQLLHARDSAGNLLPLKPGSLFEENQLALSSLTGTYPGMSDTKYSSYYIEAGTVHTIPIKLIPLPNQRQVIVEAGPLQDRVGNLIANGTLLTFFGEKDNQLLHYETVSQDAFARIILPISEVQGMKIHAQIAHIESETLIFP